jgi:hypothetical protein
MYSCLSFFVGSVSTFCLCNAKCPVIVYRPQKVFEDQLAPPESNTRSKSPKWSMTSLSGSLNFS